MDEYDFLSILKQLEPKLKNVLFQTSYDNREDLEQDLIERIIKIMKNNIHQDCPGFFDLLRDEQLI
ncbi:hypothetical protein [Psychrobacillus sp.]|uniref:hypothetical protein n=1 Tax=Psychrobacillus sp. TaxID=1871623 RepID=UPI0028BEB4CA|nr:hypothetical protein [Psychrobacillus sp.]